VIAVIARDQLAFHFAAQLGKINELLSHFFIGHYSSPLEAWLSSVTTRADTSAEAAGRHFQLHELFLPDRLDGLRPFIDSRGTFQAWGGRSPCFPIHSNRKILTEQQ